MSALYTLRHVNKRNKTHIQHFRLQKICLSSTDMQHKGFLDRFVHFRGKSLNTHEVTAGSQGEWMGVGSNIIS